MSDQCSAAEGNRQAGGRVEQIPKQRVTDAAVSGNVDMSLSAGVVKCYIPNFTPFGGKLLQECLALIGGGNP